MRFVALNLAGLLVVGLPTWAASSWVAASRGRRSSRGEMVALVGAGIGVACWAVWIGTSLVSWSVPVIAAAIVGVSAVLWLDARRLRAQGSALAAADGGGAAAKLGLAGLAMLALLVPPFLTFGFGRADGVHTLSMTDWYKHLVVAAGIDGGGVFPPPNPFLATDTEPGYYFGFHLVAAAVRQLALVDVDVYAALLALTFVTGAVLPAAVWLYARDLCGRRGAIWAALAAGFLAGFDLIVLGIDTLRNLFGNWPLPGGLAGLRALIPSTHLDYWVHHNERQFSSPYITTLWAPQHTAAVLLALVVIWLVTASSDGERRRGWLLPAICIAALPALSAFVALALGFGVACYLLVEAIAARTPPWSTAAGRRWLRPGVVAAVLAIPVLRVLAAAEGPGLVLAISGSGDWSNGAIFNALFGSSWWTNLLDSPAVYAVELGVVGLLGAAELLRRGREHALSAAQRQAGLLVAAMLVLVTFVRSPVGGPNNLYARPMVLIFCMLTPMAVLGAARVRRPVLIVAVAVCLLGTGFALAGNVMQGALFWASSPALVEAGAWTNEHTPRADAVAVHPDDFTRYFGFWFRRPLVVADERHARLLGASEDLFEHTSLGLAEAYASRLPAEAARRFDALGARTIVVALARGAPAWAVGPCFDVGYRNDDWLIVRRRPDSCTPGS